MIHSLKLLLTYLFMCLIAGVLFTAAGIAVGLAWLAVALAKLFKHFFTKG